MSLKAHEPHSRIQDGPTSLSLRVIQVPTRSPSHRSSDSESPSLGPWAGPGWQPEAQPEAGFKSPGQDSPGSQDDAPSHRSRAGTGTRQPPGETQAPGSRVPKARTGTHWQPLSSRLLGRSPRLEAGDPPGTGCQQPQGPGQLGGPTGAEGPGGIQVGTGSACAARIRHL